MSLTYDAFKTQVLPLLQAKHGGGAALVKAIETFVTETPIVDEQGQAIELDVQALSGEAGNSGGGGDNTAGQASRGTPSGGDGSDEQIERLVKQALTRLGGRHDGADDHRRAPFALTRSERSRGGGRQATGGFAGFGEFALSVHKASAQGGSVDPRLITKAAPSTYAHEGAGDAGGYLVPQDWADRLWEIVLGDEALLARTNQIPTSRNALSLPVSESTPWGSGGVQAYWMSEAGQITQSRPSFQYRNLRLQKLAAVVPASDELLEDAPALDAFIGREAARAIRYKADDAILNGDGVGKPLGILNADATVSVAKESGQSADTVTAANIAKMYARMPASSISSAVWLINQDVLPQLLTLTLGNQPVYLPPSGMSGAPFGTLLGRPILLTQHAQKVGDRGDILFADLRQYLTLTKRSGLQAAASMHLWFDHDLTAFRFTFRIAGQPWLGSSLTPDNSSDALSPFVTLAERA